MSVLLWTVVVGLLAAAGVLVPLIPAFAEWSLRSDAEPLQVVRRQDTNVRHFAEGFHRRIREWLRNALPAGAAETRAPPWDGREPIRLHAAGTEAVLPEELAQGRVDTVLVLLADVELPGQVVYEQEIYGCASVRCRSAATLRAAYSERSLQLGAATSVARWVHAGTRLTIASGCTLYGRATADERIVLEEGVHFERLHAPIIRCGTPASVLAVDRASRSDWLPPDAMELSPRVRLVRGDCAVPPDVHVRHDLIVRGRLRIGAGARIDGNLKAHDDIEVETGTVVRGALVSRRNIHVSPACKIRGPVIAEFAVSIAPGTVIGTPRQPTTVTAADIIVDSGVQVSGSLWAHRRGYTSQQLAPARL